MIKKIMMAALAVSALALNAPAASAGHQTVSCRFNALSQGTVTGQDTWEGAAQGYIVGNAGESVSIRCVVRVNGAVRASTSVGVGTTVATTADRVTFAATLTETTQLCAQYTTAHGSGETCFATTTTTIPPDEVWDAIDAVFELFFDTADPVFDEITKIEKEHIDPKLCPELAKLKGTYGGPPPVPVIVITEFGDIYIDGILFWDCPPYEPEPVA